MPADQGWVEAPGRTRDGAQDWADDVPPRELTGGWPAVRLDEPLETQHFEQVRVERVGPRPPVPAPTHHLRPWDAPLPTPPWEVPATTSWPVALEPDVPPTSTFAAVPPRVSTPQPIRDEPSAGPQLWSSLDRHEGGAPASRHSARDAPAVPPTSAFTMSRPTSPSFDPPAEPRTPPTEWPAERSRVEPSTSPSVRPVPYRRRSDDAAGADPVDPAAATTLQRPAVPPAKPPVRIDDRGGYRVAVREDPVPEPGPTTQGTRVAEILAENGVSPATGGRRRRRYRDEDEPDDVLARVLRGN
jgi:hypothetical protein